MVMAQGRRTERVAALIRREMSDLLSRGLRDQRLARSMVSITNVEVASDLQHCKIFVSVFGSEEDRKLTMAGLESARPHVRGELGRRLQMRRTPEVAFVLDRGLEKGSSVLGLLSRLEQERQHKEAGPHPVAGEMEDPASPSAIPDATASGSGAPGSGNAGPEAPGV
jgi:ribosome-binding factor A